LHFCVLVFALILFNEKWFVLKSIYNCLADDNEGWETVHRGGKSKTKSSPSQRSLENLAGVGKAMTGRNLKRTYSDPHAGTIRKSRFGSDNKAHLAQKSMSVGNHVNHLPRQRTDSKDSEKENRPSGQSKTPEENKTVSQSVSDSRGTDTKGKMLYSSYVIKGNTQQSCNRKDQGKRDTKLDSGDNTGQHSARNSTEVKKAFIMVLAFK